ncbi:MAG: efflux RND transporter permease subunit [Alicyclobacillaceae bacterium]|nr:efflux RND transporter permease subunit [Alicyclobacillaceae bacterium]
MIRSITRFSLQNPLVVAIVSLLLAVAGGLSTSQLKQELMPDISFPVLAVVTPYPGASPEEVARSVTEPLENALRGLDGVRTVNSTSLQNISEIELQLDMNANLAAVQQKAEQLLSQVQLPSGAETPKVEQFSFDSAPIVQFAVAATNTPGTDDPHLRRLVNQVIVPALQNVPGVSSVQTAAGLPDQVSIELNPARLAHYHLTADQVIQALQADNVTMPLGTVALSDRTRSVELQSRLASVDDLRNLRIPVPANAAAGLQGVGQSVRALGNAVGQVVQGLGQVQQAVGAVGQNVGLVEAQTQLLKQLQSIQEQLFGAQLALAREQAKPSNLQDPVAIARLQATIEGLQRGQANLESRWNALQPARGETSAASLAGQVAPSTSPQARQPGRPAVSGSAAALPAAAGAANRIPKPTEGTSARLTTIRLSDVATVRLAPPAGMAISRTNGQPSVYVGVAKTEDANTVDTAQAIQDELRKLQPQLPRGVQIIPLFDDSHVIRASILGMLREAVLGACFAALVILLFLRNLRTTLIAVVSIPLSLLTALLVLGRLHISLNIMTLGGLAVATGRVVDDSIVVIENIYRHWRSAASRSKTLVLTAAGEVGQAITSSTITTVAVFLPLGFVSGVVGRVFMPFAVTVIVALVSSLLVALTVVPVLSWLLVVRRPALDPVRPDAPAAAARPSRLHQAYRRALTWSLEHKAWVLAATGAALVASIAVLPLAGSTFIPESAEKYATISVTLPNGATRQQTDAKARQVEAVIRSFGHTVLLYDTMVGSDPGQLNMSGGISGQNAASIFLQLDPDTDVPRFVEDMRRKLRPIAGDAQLQVREVTFGGATGAFTVVVHGGSAADIRRAASAITRTLAGVPGLANVENNLTLTQPEVRVTPDSAKAAPYGLTNYQIANAVRMYLTGQNIGSVRLGGSSTDVVVSVQPSPAPVSLAAVRALPLQTPTGQTVPLSAVADVSMAKTPVSILHLNGEPYAKVSADFTTANTGRTSSEAMRRIQQLRLPAGVSIELTGDTQEQNESFSQLIEAILGSSGLVYLVMLVAFGEWSAPFAILFSMPAALIGAFFGTVIGRQPVSVSSLIGILMLMGIVVTNAIVLVDRVEQQRKRGLSVRDALLEAGTTRMRPILMTATATICALLPLAAGYAEGALISQGLAVVVIGGLVTSTALTLVIVPIVYELLHLRTHRRERTGLAPASGPLMTADSAHEQPGSG